MTGDLFAALNRTGPASPSQPGAGGHLGELLDLLADKTINGTLAKEVFEAMVETGKTPPPSSMSVACAR